MTTIHNIAAHALGGLTGIQSSQRDWSPYLVHFTNWKAMDLVRLTVGLGTKPSDLAETLDEADAKSFAVVEKIAGSSQLLATQLADKKGATHGIPPCVCFCECNLPGLIAHCERYGRFGFVFKKCDVFKSGGRPCIYVDRDTYGLLDLTYATSSNPLERRLFGLANVLSPPGSGQVQDYTHEREWRHFGDFPLGELSAVLCPLTFVERIRSLFPTRVVIPIDVLHQWGA